MENDRWMTRQEVADHFRVHVQTVDRWRREEGMPCHRVSENAAPRFRQSEVDGWFADRAGVVS